MNHFHDGVAVSRTALSLGMPAHAPLGQNREHAAPKPRPSSVIRKKPRTNIGADVAVDMKPQAEAVHNNLRKIGLTLAYSSLTLRAFMRGAGIQSLDDAGVSTNYLRRDSDNDPAIAEEITATDIAKDPMFTRVVYNDKDITFITGKSTITESLYIDPRSASFEKLIKRLIPSYDSPIGYEKTVGYSATADFGANTDQDIDVTISYNDLVNVVRSSGMTMSSALFCGKSQLPDGVDVRVNLRGKLRAEIKSATDYPSIPSLPMGKGSLPSNAYGIMRLAVTYLITVPKAWAMWATYAEREEEFVPTLALAHFSNLMSLALGFKGGRGKDENKRTAAAFSRENEGRLKAKFNEAGARISNVATAKRRNASRNKLLGFEAKIRTNADGFAILPNGALFYIPQTDNVEEYVRISKEASDGTLDGARFDFPNRVLYVDAVNEVIVYTTSTSTVQTASLRGSRPLDDISVAKHALHWAIPSSAIKHLPLLNGTIDLPYPASLVSKLVRMYNTPSEKENLDAANALPWLQALWQPIPESGQHPAAHTMQPSDWSNLLSLVDDKGVPLIPPGDERTRLRGLLTSRDTSGSMEAREAENTVLAKMHEAVTAFTIEAQKFAAAGAFDVSFPEGSIPVPTLNTYRVSLYAFTHMLPRWPACHAKRLKNHRTNTPKPLDRFALKDKPISLPNFTSDFLFPHQAEVIQNLDVDEPPEAAVIGGAPGFGKTVAIMADVLLLLKKGKIKRPLVIVPNKLEAQFVDEINRFTGGKVNAYCATYKNLQAMQSATGFNFSYEDTVKFLRDLPPNTILVTNYNTLTNKYSRFKELYEAVSSYDSKGTSTPLMAFPFVDLFYAAGVDYVCGDESHKVKNLDSGRAEAFLAMCAKVDYIRLSSGTTVNNVVTDLVGQMQKINPLALGASLEAFKNRFLGGDNQVTTSSQAEDITDAMRDYAMVIQKDSRSWSYLLPPLTEIYHRVPLSDLQARYYQVLFYKAIVAIKKEASEKKISLDDDEEDALGGRSRRRRSSGEEMEDGSPQQAKKDNKVEGIAKRHFGTIDRFVNSPDSFVDFVDGTWTADEEDVRRSKIDAEPLSEEERANWPVLVPSADDLVSAKAKHAYLLMYAHFDMKGALAQVQAIKDSENYFADPENKLISLSPYKVTGTHLFDNMPADLKAMAVRYQANSFVEVDKFKRDPKVKIIVADEISITEGHNLQVASRTLRMQGVWTPGAETQALARTRRPDTKGSRKRLGYDVISATLPTNSGNERPTIDDLRTARLLAKKLSNSRVEFGYDLSYQRAVGQVVAGLPPVKMSMKNIQEFNPAELGKYFDALKRLNRWSYDSSQAQIRKIADDIFEATGEQLLDEDGRIKDLAAFVNAAVVRPTPGPELVGSKRCYVPWVGGNIPINPLGFDLIPVRSATPMSVDDEDDDSDGEEGDEEELSFDRIQNNVTLNLGDHVMTEYGPGIVVRAGRRKRVAGTSKDDMSDEAYHDPSTFYIEIPSIVNGKVPLTVVLEANRVFVPADANGKKTLRDAIKNRTNTMNAPIPNKITPDQLDAARDRKAERKQEEERRNRNPSENGIFEDYAAPDKYSADDFDFDDEDFDILMDEIDVEEDPIDGLANMLDEDGNLTDYEDDVELDDEEEEDVAEGIQYYSSALTINGQLAILLDAETPEDLDVAITDYGFRRFPDFARLEVKTPAALQTILTRLAKNRYVIPPQNLAEIQTLSSGLTQRGRLKQVEPYNFREITNFMLTEQKRVPAGNNGSKPFRLYAMVIRGKFYLVASIQRHPFNVTQVLRNASAGIGGAVGQLDEFEDMAVTFAPNKRAAQTVAQKMIDAGLIENGEELIKQLQTFNVGGVNANLLNPPEPKAAPAVKPLAPKVTVKPVAQTKVSDYVQGPDNPDVENLKEFRIFLEHARNATMELIKGNIDGIVTGAAYRVKAYSRNKFWLSNLKTQKTREEFIDFDIPPENRIKFENGKGLLIVGKNVWRLSYTNK